MIQNSSKIWFRVNDLRNEIGIIKRYLGEGSYLVYAIDKEREFVVFQTDIIQVLR